LVATTLLLTSPTISVADPVDEEETLEEVDVDSDLEAKEYLFDEDEDDEDYEEGDVVVNDNILD
jgi:hypothetical protein